MTEEEAIKKGYLLLSYSSINALINCNQWWINKQMCLKEQDFEFFRDGKAVHRIVQDHVSKKILNDTLERSGITGATFYFPVVEQVDYDPRTKFTYEVDGKYLIRGYADGLDDDMTKVKRSDRLLEIKSGSKLWSFGEFIRSMQRKMYVLGFDSKESILVTTDKHCTVAKAYRVPSSEKDKQEALEFIREGINVIEKGTFDEAKTPVCKYCIFRDSCPKRGQMSASKDNDHA